MIAVTAMLTKPPTTLENIAREPLAAGNELGWRARVLFFAGMVTLGGGSGRMQPNPDASLSC